MPCSDGGPVYHDDPETKARLDRVTRMLCSLCGRLETEGKIGYFLEVRGLSDWWANHKEEDQRRLERERKEREEKEAKRKALAKLSPRERRLLGVRD